MMNARRCTRGIRFSCVNRALEPPGPGRPNGREEARRSHDNALDRDGESSAEYRLELCDVNRGP